MKIPIVLKTPAAMPAPGRLYYEVAENGIFQVRDTELYRAVTRAALPLPGLAPGREELVIHFPRLGRAAVEDVLAFFRQVHRWCGGEAVVIIFYAPEQQEYRLVAPPQRLPGRWHGDGRWWADYAVRYESVPRPEGFVRFGTIHSHADLPAYASGLDCDDERYEDGLHIVFGNFGTRRISVAAAFVAGGTRFEVSAADVLEDADVPTRGARVEWIAQVVRADKTGSRRRPAGGEPGHGGARGRNGAVPLPAGPPGRTGGVVTGRSDTMTSLPPRVVRVEAVEGAGQAEPADPADAADGAGAADVPDAAGSIASRRAGGET